MMSREDAITGTSPALVAGRQYHLQTGPQDLAPLCLLVGSPERATHIADRFFAEATLVGDHRGLRSYTGSHNGTAMSVVTTGMGGPSAGMVVAEASKSGAQIFIRVGTCGTLREEAKVGHSVICTGAARFDGASDNWAPPEYPAVPDWRVVAACVSAAEELKVRHHTGIGVTTSCFREGQARVEKGGYLPPLLRDRHEWLVRIGALFYAMEEAALFTWCLTHGQIPIGGVNTVFANRVDDMFSPADESKSIGIALLALKKLEPLVLPRP